MVHIRQSFFSIATAVIFSILGLLYGLGAAKGMGATIGSAELSTSVTWALAGLMFVMSYFALVHIKD